MANLFDIGKSGLESYRQALSVTGQNIANIDTDGYKRREASLEEISGGKGGITSIGKETGLGVRVTSIRRSFDEFLLVQYAIHGCSREVIVRLQLVRKLVALVST